MTTVGADLELTRLTLDQIVSDLDSLASDHALFTLGSASNSSTSHRPQKDDDLLRSFENGSVPSSKTQYVELSHQLIAAHHTAQRLNSERVSAAQVSLILPSERHYSSSSSRGGEERATRTDLLHRKVADLQTQADAWDVALTYALALVDDPHGKTGPGIGERSQLEAGVPHQTIEAISDLIPPVPAEAEAATEEDDDDPWNDLS